MARVHFLNVGNGDCSIIQHATGRVTVIDVNKARRPEIGKSASFESRIVSLSAGGGGNFNQRLSPVNPIEHMQYHKIDSIFRFILTHPDMDHMDGIKDLFEIFSPINFWDTANNCKKDRDGFSSSPYRYEDWQFYQKLRAGQLGSPKYLNYTSESARVNFWDADGLYILSPSASLVQQANSSSDYNDCSYVILYYSNSGRKVIFAGDSHDATWEHILTTQSKLISNVDLLIAPHHGRKSDRRYNFLDVLRPKLTLFGVAPSEHLAYQPWTNRDLPYITNNQAGSVIMDMDNGYVYVTNEAFARRENPSTQFDQSYGGYFLKKILTDAEKQQQDILNRLRTGRAG